MSKVLVQTTLFENPIEVDEDELPFLETQGLVKEVLGGKPLPQRKPADPAPAKETS